jgi:deoxyadenosine/deoxycytidine kinase
MSRIVIDGNIGSGKTTQLDLLEKKGWKVQKEPIDQWPLKQFYENPKKWAFQLHLKILQTIQPFVTKEDVVYERSILSSKHVFWEILLKKGVVTSEQNEMYCDLYKNHEWFPDLYIFLRKSPEKCFEHIQKRGQAGDSKVTLEYLKDLDEEYSKMIRTLECRVIFINADQPVEEINKEICRYISGNELFFSDTLRKKVLEEGGQWGKMQMSRAKDMCRMS